MGKKDKSKNAEKGQHKKGQHISIKIKVCKKCCGTSAKELNRRLGTKVCSKGCMGACSKKARERRGDGVCARVNGSLIFAPSARELVGGLAAD